MMKPKQQSTGIYFILGHNGKYMEAKNAKGQSYYIRFKTLRQAEKFIKSQGNGA